MIDEVSKGRDPADLDDHLNVGDRLKRLFDWE